MFWVIGRLLRRKSCRASGSTRFSSLWVGRRPMRNSSIAMIGLRPPPDDVGPQKRCKVWIALISNRSCCFPKEAMVYFCCQPKGDIMKEKTDVPQGTLALMVLKTLDVLGSLHGYGIARRIEQISGDLLAVNQGTLYPLLLKLAQEGAIASEWGASENNRRARFYRLTREGRKQLRVKTQDWQQTAAIIARFFEAKPEDLSLNL